MEIDLRLIRSLLSGNTLSAKREIAELSESIEAEIGEGGGGSTFDDNVTIEKITPSLFLSGDPNDTAQIVVVGAGCQLYIAAADGSDVELFETGGEVIITSGSGADDGDGGDLTIQTGVGGANADGGNITIKSGQSADGDGGEISIRANPDVSSGQNGGDIFVVAGNGNNSGGNVVIEAGTPDGYVQFNWNSGSIEGNENGLFLPAVIDLSQIPTVDPSVAGQLWSDNGTLKISGG